MQIQLEQITFNFDPAQPNNEKLNVRSDSMDSFPEWRDVDEFVIAHVVAEGSPFEIKARFSSPDLSLRHTPIEVQAVPVGTNPLGNVPPVPVNFNSNGTAEVSVPLPDSKLGNGVQSCTVAWEWSYRAKEDEEWTPFQTTRQRLYCTIGKPTEPWKTEKPWPEVLEWACRWAKGAKNEPEAATKITKAVFALGTQGKVVYATDGGPTYAHKKFNCARFLKLLGGGTREPRAVNCDDCATIVSTFGNILGCDLEQSEIGYKFYTNYIFPIGLNRWGTTRFTKHAVAWKNNCSVDDPLYDACLQLDVDGDPHDIKQVGHQAGLPTNLIFGYGKKNDYKFRLVADGENANPHPGEKQRRKIADSHFGSRSFKGVEYTQILKDHFDFDSWPSDKAWPPIVPKIPLADFIKEHPAFDGWEQTETKQFNSDILTSVERITLFSTKRDSTQLVELYLYAGPSSPNDFLLQILAQFDSMQIHRRDSNLVDALVFDNEEKTLNLVKHRQLIGLVRSVGTKPVSITQMGEALEQFLGLQSASDIALTDSHTLLPFKTVSELTLGEPNMTTHKLARSWPCFIGGRSGLDAEGHMDLSAMDEEGNLEDGSYYVNNKRYRLKGSAVGGTPLELTLHLYDEPGDAIVATFFGTLVRENADSSIMVIFGKVHYELKTKEQNDPPWVITKP